MKEPEVINYVWNQQYILSRYINYLKYPKRLARTLLLMFTKYLQLPQMLPNEMNAIIDVLRAYTNPTCLEWGCGYSTLFFPNYIGKGTWITIEDNKTWLDRIHQSIKTNDTKLVFIPPPRIDVSNVETKIVNEYCSWPLNQSVKYDVILIDGLFRVKCAEVASQVLKEGGSVFIHDTCDGLYHEAFDYFNQVLPLRDVGFKCSYLTQLKDPK